MAMHKRFTFDKDAPKIFEHPDAREKSRRSDPATVKSWSKQRASPKSKLTMGKGRVRVGKSKS
jgi:hypothetical protein